jgi:hypothetical protein
LSAQIGFRSEMHSENEGLLSRAVGVLPIAELLYQFSVRAITMELG